MADLVRAMDCNLEVISWMYLVVEMNFESSGERILKT